jgi:hypothetical protein
MNYSSALSGIGGHFQLGVGQLTGRNTDDARRSAQIATDLGAFCE